MEVVSYWSSGSFVTGSVSRSSIDPDVRERIRNKVLADTLPSATESYEIGILIGNDYYDEFVNEKKYKLQPGLFMIESKFGWILSGRMKCSENCSEQSSLATMSLLCVTQWSPGVNNFLKIEKGISATSFRDKKEKVLSAAMKNLGRKMEKGTNLTLT